uniref:Uncharacterized protein n=1 Tax=Populus trichocarpa TaxID=3694 RepID=B9INE1_POPTR
MRIQLQEMLHGYGAKFSQYFDENKGPTEGPVWLMSFGSIVELDEGSRIKPDLLQYMPITPDSPLHANVQHSRSMDHNIKCSTCNVFCHILATCLNNNDKAPMTGEAKRKNGWDYLSV